MYKYLLFSNGENERPILRCSGTFSGEEDLLDTWCQQKEDGYFPDHIENVIDQCSTEAHPDEVLAMSKDLTRQRFGMGQYERDDGVYDQIDPDWLLIRVDICTFDVVTYPFTDYVPAESTDEHPDWKCPDCGNDRVFTMVTDGDFEMTRLTEGNEQFDSFDYTTRQCQFIRCNICFKKGDKETFEKE